MFVIWPLFIRFFFKLVIWTAGLVTVLVNGFIVAGGQLDLSQPAWWRTSAGPFSSRSSSTIVLTALLGFISFEDAGVFRRIVLRRQKTVGGPEQRRQTRRDLPRDRRSRPRRAQAGHGRRQSAHLRKWIESGSHRLVPWETDLSSQTSASQAGLLHGNNSDIPAFRWFDKELGRVVVSSNLKVLGPFEKAHSDGNGLLAHGGTARASMLSGDADEVMLVASRVTEEKGESYRSFFASPLSFTHTVMLFFWEMILETGAKWSQRIRKEEPRIDRHLKYAVLRAGMTVALARPQPQRSGRRHAARRPLLLRDPRRLRRGGPPFRARPPRHPHGAAQDGRPHAQPPEPGQDRAHATTTSWSSPTTARPWVRPSCSATATTWRSWSGSRSRRHHRRRAQHLRGER